MLSRVPLAPCMALRLGAELDRRNRRNCKLLQQGIIRKFPTHALKHLQQAPSSHALSCERGNSGKVMQCNARLAQHIAQCGANIHLRSDLRTKPARPLIRRRECLKLERLASRVGLRSFYEYLNGVPYT
jgi:hypothetical protein